MSDGTCTRMSKSLGRMVWFREKGKAVARRLSGMKDRAQSQWMKQWGREESDCTGWHLHTPENHRENLNGFPFPLVSGSAIGEPLRSLEAGRPEYFFPRLHQADCVSWLKVTNNSRQPILHECLVLGFDNNSLLSFLRPPTLLAPGFCTIPCGFSTPYLYLCKCSLFKTLFEFSYFDVPSVSLLGLWVIPR